MCRLRANCSCLVFFADHNKKIKTLWEPWKKGIALMSFLPFNSNFPPLSGHNICVFTVHVSDATSAQRGPPQVDIRAHYQLHNRYRIYFKITNNYFSLPPRPPAVSDINFPHTAFSSLRQSHGTLFDLSVRIVEAWSCFNWVSLVKINGICHQYVKQALVDCVFVSY